MEEEPEYVYHSDNQWFGRKTCPRPKIFVEHLNDGGSGLFQWDTELPDRCFDFVLDQMIRFGLPMSERLGNIVIYSARTALFYFSNFDPYVFFTRGLSDVRVSDDWHQFSFEVKKELPGGKYIFYEPDPDAIEPYRLALDEGEMAFREFLRRDFLDYGAALEGERGAHELHDIAIELRDQIQLHTTEAAMRALLGDDGYRELRAFCTYTELGSGTRVVDMERVEFYFAFAAWATFVWLMSPLSRDWRCENNLLTRVVHEEGEALLVGYHVAGRSDFRRKNRPVLSCYRCGVQSWCLVDDFRSGAFLLICESCATEGLPISPPANCGFKLCRMPQCRHHPLFAFDPNRRLHSTMRTTGLIARQAAEHPLLADKTQGRNLLR